MYRDVLCSQLPVNDPFMVTDAPIPTSIPAGEGPMRVDRPRRFVFGRASRTALSLAG